MYQDHPCFKPPPQENAVIWRYMDLAKLVCMLHARSLHFTRIDHFDDRFEGALPKRHVEALRNAREMDKAEHADIWKALAEMGLSRDYTIEHYMDWRPNIAVNCWHQNEYESAAMWSQYLKGGEGIAIRSSYRKLVDSFDNQDDSLVIFVGVVQYIDHENDIIENYNNALLPMLHKRASFRHENELRVAAMGGQRHGKGYSINLREFEETGIDIQVDLRVLVDAVYVAPGSPGFFRRSVESVVEKYDLRVPVKLSSLDDAPLW